MEEFGFLPFKSVPDELQRPAGKKQYQCVNPEPVGRDAGDKQHDRQGNQRNAEGMAGAVHRVLMTAGVLRDPLFVGPSAEHAGNHTPGTQAPTALV